MGYTSSRRKYGRKVLTKANKSRQASIISHDNSNESNNLKISYHDNVKITSNCPDPTVHHGSL